MWVPVFSSKWCLMYSSLTSICLLFNWQLYDHLAISDHQGIAKRYSKWLTNANCGSKFDQSLSRPCVYQPCTQFSFWTLWYRPFYQFNDLFGQISFDYRYLAQNDHLVHYQYLDDIFSSELFDLICKIYQLLSYLKHYLDPLFYC